MTDDYIMKTQDVDIEEDILEDPIKIIFETDKYIDGQSDDLGIKYSGFISNDEEYRRSDPTKKNKRDRYPSSRIVISKSDRTIYEIKQVFIKIVDFNKYPWYYIKYTALILEKRKEFTNDLNYNREYAKSGNMQNNGLKTHRATQNNEQKEYTQQRIPNILIMKYDKNVWKVGNKHDSEMQKNDMDLKKAISRKNVNIIDYKKNTGLVGLTIKQKLMVNDDNVTPKVKKSLTGKSKSVESKSKHSVGGKNKKDVRSVNSRSKRKMSIENYIYKKSSKTELGSEDQNSQRINLTNDTTIGPEKTSNQLINKKIYSTASIMKKDLASQSSPIENILDKQEVLQSTRSVVFTRTSPKREETMQENPEENIEKILEEPINVRSIQSVSPSTNLTTTSLNKSELVINGALNQISKINLVKLSTREERNTNSVVRLQPRIPNYNNQHRQIVTLFANNSSQIRYRLPIYRLSPTNRFHLSNSQPYLPFRQNFSWQRNYPNNNLYYHPNRVYTRHALLTQPPPPYYRFQLAPLLPLNQIRPSQYFENVAPVNCNAIYNARHTNIIKNFMPTPNNSFQINNLTPNKNIVSSQLNLSKTIHSQKIAIKMHNNITKNVEVEKSVVHNKRTWITGDDNTLDQGAELPEKKMKLENSSNYEAKDDVNKERQGLTDNEYSPPILPIPNYDTILSILKLRHTTTRYWRIDTDDNGDGSPEENDIHGENKLTESEVDTDKVVDINNVRKISLAEYKRRASVNNS